jgi:hypothetical protein
MIFRTTVLAAASALALAGAAHADSLRPIEARSLDLGAVSGTAYYTIERDGFRVVATLAPQTGTPMRLEAVLAPGQSVVLSTPREAGAASQAVEISRRDDQVLVRTAAAATN